MHARPRPPRRRSPCLLGLAVIIIALAATPSTAVASSPTAKAGAAARPACVAATQKVVDAKQALKRAKKALARAKTASAKAKARKKVASAKKALTRAQSAQVVACANRPPQFPSLLSWSGNTEFHYDQFGYLSGITDTFILGTPATDPDGDPITYSWHVSNGTVTSDGLTAVWTRELLGGWPRSGVLTVFATDPYGAFDWIDFKFE
jgi:hypothetical protein